MAVKPIDETMTIQVIFPGDTAIDTESSDVKAYLEGMRKNPECWGEHIKPRTGEKITKFVLGVIPPNEHSAIMDMQGENQQWWHAFVTSLRDIVDGPMLETAEKKEVPKTPSGRVDERWLRRVFGWRNAAIARNIGMQALIWHQFTEDDARP